MYDKLRKQKTVVHNKGTCGLFFSGYAEGSSNNKFLEIYNPTDASINLAGFAFPNVGNAVTTPVKHEYWINSMIEQ